MPIRITWSRRERGSSSRKGRVGGVENRKGEGKVCGPNVAGGDANLPSKGACDLYQNQHLAD